MTMQELACENQFRAHSRSPVTGQVRTCAADLTEPPPCTTMQPLVKSWLRHHMPDGQPIDIISIGPRTTQESANIPACSPLFGAAVTGCSLCGAYPAFGGLRTTRQPRPLLRAAAPPTGAPAAVVSTPAGLRRRPQPNRRSLACRGRCVGRYVRLAGWRTRLSGREVHRRLLWRRQDRIQQGAERYLLRFPEACTSSAARVVSLRSLPFFTATASCLSFPLHPRPSAPLPSLLYLIA